MTRHDDSGTDAHAAPGDTAHDAIAAGPHAQAHTHDADTGATRTGDDAPALTPVVRPAGPRAQGDYVFVGAAYPHTGGAAPFNHAIVGAFREEGRCDFVSWRRMYPPLVYRGDPFGDADMPPHCPPARHVLDWHRPRSWRAVERAVGPETDALILPWLHPVMMPPYRSMLRRARVPRIVICHNVELHERMRLHRHLTTQVLGRADLLVAHHEGQLAELAALGLGDIPTVVTGHPRLLAEDLAPIPTRAEVARERARQGDTDLHLLAFGAVRPYKGIDVALRALGLLRGRLRVRLVVAGRFWHGAGELSALARECGVDDQVEFRDGYVPAREAARLFCAADAVCLPYRQASQSGVIAEAFGYRRPVIATRVGGLSAMVRDDRDGILCDPEDPAALAEAIRYVADHHTRLAAGVDPLPYAESPARYAAAIEDALRGRV